MTEPVATTAPVTAERAAVWEDFIDIFYAPSAVFSRRIRGNFWIPLFVVTIAVGVLFYLNMGVLQPVFDAEWDRNIARVMQRNPRFTAEGAAKMKDFVARFAGISVLVSTPCTIVLTGLATWVVGKAFEAKQAVRSALVVAAYAFIPRILESVINGLQGLVLAPDQLDGRFRLSLGVGRFLDPDTTPPIVLALLGRVDLFTIWITILLAIGLSVTGGISRSRAYMAGAIVWMVGALPGLLGALRS